MQGFRLNSQGLVVLASVHLDRLLGLAVVGTSLWLGTCLCSYGLR
jgi:hypothetical protein